MLPATRLRREKGFVRLDLDDEECDARWAHVLARRGLAGSRSDAAEALTLLGQPLVANSYSELLVNEQHRFDAIADALRRTYPDLAP
jgi:hypothetical protein